MNQTCRVCGEPAAGFHFGAFTCEGCKSFFGRSYNNLNANECKNNNKCIIDKKNRTTCKSCRLRKCLLVGMSKGSSRYGRRSNWFKIHCLLQEHQQQAMEAAGKAVNGVSAGGIPPSSLSANIQQAEFQHHHQQLQQQQHQQQQQQQHQQRNNAAAAQLAAAHGFLGAYPGYAAHHHAHQLPIDGSSASPFMPAAIAAAAAAARHPVAAEAAAFFSMMNSPQSAFQLPPHLLLSAAAAGYHQNAAAAAAADAAYRAEMYRHRQSVDSAASGDSQRYASASAEQRLQSAASSPNLARQSPELRVSGDDEEIKHESSTKSPIAATTPTLTTTIHSPIPIRAQPLDLNSLSHGTLNNISSNNSITDSNSRPFATTTASSPIGVSSIVPTPTPTPTSSSQPRTPEPILATPATVQYSHHNTLTAAQQLQQQHQQQQQQQEASLSLSPQPNAEQTALAFAAKMQSLSPVSVCSIGAETMPPTLISNDQDCPIDLSMKPTGINRTDVDSAPPQKAMRRKFYQLHSENESSSSSTTSSLSVATSPAYSHYQHQHDENADNTNNNSSTNNNSNNSNNNDNNSNNNNILKNEISAPSSPTELISVNEHVKRQKLSSAVEAAAVGAATATATTAVATSFNNFTASNHGTTNLHGFFVCV